MAQAILQPAQPRHEPVQEPPQGHMGAGVHPRTCWVSVRNSHWTHQDAEEKQLWHRGRSGGRSLTRLRALQLQRSNLMQTEPCPRPWNQGRVFPDVEKVRASSQCDEI